MRSRIQPKLFITAVHAPFLRLWAVFTIPRCFKIVFIEGCLQSPTSVRLFFVAAMAWYYKEGGLILQITLSFACQGRNSSYCCTCICTCAVSSLKPSFLPNGWICSPNVSDPSYELCKSVPSTQRLGISQWHICACACAIKCAHPHEVPELVSTASNRYSFLSCIVWSVAFCFRPFLLFWTSYLAYMATIPVCILHVWAMITCSFFSCRDYMRLFTRELSSLPESHCFKIYKSWLFAFLFPISSSFQTEFNPNSLFWFSNPSMQNPGLQVPSQVMV